MGLSFHNRHALHAVLLYLRVYGDYPYGKEGAEMLIEFSSAYAEIILLQPIQTRVFFLFPRTCKGYPLLTKVCVISVVFSRISGSYPAWASATLRIIVFPRVCGGYPYGKEAQIVIDFIPLVYTGVIRPIGDGFKLKFYFSAHAGVILHDLLITISSASSPVYGRLSLFSGVKSHLKFCPRVCGVVLGEQT